MRGQGVVKPMLCRINHVELNLLCGQEVSVHSAVEPQVPIRRNIHVRSISESVIHLLSFTNSVTKSRGAELAAVIVQ